MSEHVTCQIRWESRLEHVSNVHARTIRFLHARKLVTACGPAFLQVASQDGVLSKYQVMFFGGWFQLLVPAPLASRIHPPRSRSIGTELALAEASRQQVRSHLLQWCGCGLKPVTAFECGLSLHWAEGGCISCLPQWSRVGAYSGCADRLLAPMTCGAAYIIWHSPIMVNLYWNDEGGLHRFAVCALAPCLAASWCASSSRENSLRACRCWSLCFARSSMHKRLGPSRP